MHEYDPVLAHKAWGEKHITPLNNPIAEFNARGGMDLHQYQTLEDHTAIEHPNLGSEAWADILETLPPIETFTYPEGGQKLRVHRFNWPKTKEELAEQTVTTYTMPFSVPIDLDHLVYQHYLLAEALGTPLIVFENPSYGESDKLTPGQQQALKEHGDFKPVADTMLGIAEALGIKNINAVGYSMGADTAAAIAAKAKEFGIEVKKLFVMESAREAAQPLLPLGFNFLRDNGNLKFAWKHPVDPVLRATAKIEPALARGLFSYGVALGKGGLGEDIKHALRTQPMMKVIKGRAGSSKIDSREASNALTAELKAEFPDRSIRQIIVPGESHAFGDTGARYAYLTKLALR